MLVIKEFPAATEDSVLQQPQPSLRVSLRCSLRLQADQLPACAVKGVQLHLLPTLGRHIHDHGRDLTQFLLGIADRRAEDFVRPPVAGRCH